MRCVIDDDLPAFAAATLPWLAREPVLHNVMYGLIEQRLRGDVPVEPGCLWIQMRDHDGELCGVAIRTPPHALLLSALSPTAIDVLAGALTGVDLPGVAGPKDSSRGFLAAWRERTSVEATLAVDQRMYRLDTVIPPVDVAGQLRLATDADQPLAARWVYEFMIEAGGPHARHAELEAAKAPPYWIKGRQLWIWEVDGVPVSMAGHRAPVAGVSRVSLVYTPPEHRRHGYAAASVAALSQLLLDGDADACMLYTDLGNPTSNSVYQRIGYRPYADAETWHFTPAT